MVFGPIFSTYIVTVQFLTHLFRLHCYSTMLGALVSFTLLQCSLWRTCFVYIVTVQFLAHLLRLHCYSTIFDALVSFTLSQYNFRRACFVYIFTVYFMAHLFRLHCYSTIFGALASFTLSQYNFDALTSFTLSQCNFWRTCFVYIVTVYFMAHLFRLHCYSKIFATPDIISGMIHTL